MSLNVDYEELIVPEPVVILEEGDTALLDKIFRAVESNPSDSDQVIVSVEPFNNEPKIVLKPYKKLKSSKTQNNKPRKPPKIPRIINKVPCDICNKLISENQLECHIRIHTGEKPYTCVVCGRHFRRRNELRQHRFTHTGEKPYSCAVCGRMFSDSSAKSRHLKIHFGIKNYGCVTCGKHFTQLAHLKEHQVTHTKQKAHTCDICSKQFTTKSSLQRHILTHVNTCPDCGESFRTAERLRRHLLLHDTERPLPCTVDGCTKRFWKTGDLNLHIRSHNSERRFSCNFCGQKFKNLKNVRLHHLSHHTGIAPPITCQICKKGFFHDGALQRHSFVHKLKQRKKCPYCNLIFLTPELFQKHSCDPDAPCLQCEHCDKKYRNKNCLRKHCKQVHPDLFQGPTPTTVLSA